MKNKLVITAFLVLLFVTNVTPVFAQEASLTVGTIERPPFVFVDDDVYTGFSVELWQRLAADLQLNFTWQNEEVFAEMLADVEKGNVDLAIANISITEQRESVMDFSHPIFDSGLQILTPASTQSASLLKAVFNKEILKLVCYALIILLIAAHVVWFVERGKKGQEYFRNEYPQGIWDTFWWAFVIVTIGGFEERPPKSILGRGFAIMWTLASLFIVSLFVANFASVLTVNELQGSISNYNDLYGKRVGTIASSTSDTFLTARTIRFERYTDLEAMLQALETGELDAVVHDAPIVSHYASTLGRGKVSVSGPIFQPEKFGIAFPEDSPYVESVNRQLLKYNEDGTYDELYQKWFATE